MLPNTLYIMSPIDAPATFEVATPDCLGNALQENTLYDLDLGIKVT